MKTTIANQIIVENASLALHRWAQENLIVVNPKWQTLTRLGKQEQIERFHIQKEMCLYVQRGNDLILPFGCLNAIWGLIKDAPYQIDLNNNNDIVIKGKPLSQPLYDYQAEAVEAMVKAKGGILQGGCGSGKTNVGIEIIHSLGKKFLFLVHTGDLLRQSYKRFKTLYPDLDIGLITEGKVSMGRDGTISTVQTLSKIDKSIYWNQFDVVMLDECHHVVGSPTLVKMFSKVVNNISARYKYGLTATPARADTMIKSMYSILGTDPKGEFQPTFKIERNRIKTMEAVHIKTELSTPLSYETLNEDGTFDYQQLINFLSFNQDRNSSIVNNVVNLVKQGRKQLILCHLVAHCEDLHKQLLELGVKSELLVGKVAAKKREKILNETHNWDCVVATYAIAKEALDVPLLDTLHMTTPQKNKTIVVQSVGRIERAIEGKLQPEVYDYVDIEIPYCVGAYSKRRGQIKRRF